MSIDEAIAHALEVAELNEKRLDKEGNPYYEKCEKCAAEHRQLAEWLKELKQLREQEHCEDAVSRQAIKALEQEPILDKMRDEVINRYPKNYAGEPELNGNAFEFSLNRISQIIDKYKAEMESVK